MLLLTSEPAHRPPDASSLDMAGTKRKHEDDSSNEIVSKKSRPKASYEARVDPTYGQRSALPGLDFEPVVEIDDGELNYDDEGLDALNYLRAVRKEASTIPTLLVAPRNTTDEAHYDETEAGDGWYEDGAYYSSKIHASNPRGVGFIDEHGSEDPQLAYFDSILTRYEALRAQLQQKPPAEALEKLTDDHHTHLGRLDEKLVRWWRWKLRTVDPLPAQVASMDKGTVLRLLGLLTGGTLLRRGTEVEVGISRWAWALLARLPDQGELNSEEIGVLRELGKKAVLVGMGLKGEREWEEGIEEVEAGFEGEWDGDEEGRDREEVEMKNEIEVTNEDESDLDDAEFEKRSRSNEEYETSTDAAKEHAQSNVTGSVNGSHKNTMAPKEADRFNDEVDEGKAVVGEMDEGEMDEGEMDEGEMDEGEMDEGEMDEASAGIALEEAKARLLAGLSNEEPLECTAEGPTNADETDVRERIAKWNTKATVDMIITVAGEMYGQRDLLEFRTAWSESR